jgi:uncharacterized protein YcbK (DUF882 family)
VLTCNNTEIWKPLKNFEPYYEISSLGKVKSIRLNKIMKTYINNSGYECIDLKDSDKKHKKLVHRLVAETFLENIDELPEVNHKDENKQNNSLINLEWCTRSYNKQHSMATGTYDRLYTLKNGLGKKRSANTVSKYHNVTYDKNRNKWIGQVRHNNKNWHMKRFDTEVEAALHVNWILDTLNLTDRPKNIIT